MTPITWLLSFFFGCLHKEKLSDPQGELSGSGSFLTKHLEEGMKAEQAESRYQAWEGLFVLGDAAKQEQLFEIALNDPQRFVREEAVNFVWKQKNIALLQKARQQKNLSDGEKCLLALDIFSLSQEKSIGTWPIISEGSLEDQFFCALAATAILEVKTPWQDLLKAGDYPLSMPIVDSIVNFSSAEDLVLFESELEWAEEGIRASLWASWVLVDPSRLAVTKKQMMAFSDEECLEMVDLAWRHPAALGINDLLKHLQRQAGFCGKLADTVLISNGEKGLLGMENILEKGSRDEIVAFLLALQNYPYTSKKQERKIRSRVEQFAVYDQDPPILLAAITVLGVIGDRGSQKKMKELLEKNIDRHLLIEIEKSYNKIEKGR